LIILSDLGQIFFYQVLHNEIIYDILMFAVKIFCGIQFMSRVIRLSAEKKAVSWSYSCEIICEIT